MKKVLVAGAAGDLGRFIVNELKRKGHWVRVLVRNIEELKINDSFFVPSIHNLVDEIFIGDITKHEKLYNVCENIDIVFSCINNFTKGKLVNEYYGNINLLNVALSENVKKFIYFSIFDAYKYEYLSIVKAKEDFVRELRKSGIDYLIVRPTGFFSDMTIFLKMAKKGIAFLLGNGNNKINPVHEADVAEICVNNILSDIKEINIGGPQVLTYREIVEIAFMVLSKKTRIVSISPNFLNISTKFLFFINKDLREFIKFIFTFMQNNIVAPKYGKYQLKSYFNEIAFNI